MKVWQKVYGTAAAPLLRKHLAREMLSYKTLMLHINKCKDLRAKLKVPLVLKIDLIGYRALIIAVPPLRAESGFAIDD